ncbi:MAG: hypothetical protein LBB22_05065 [Treponema sp.]|jgi:hypothetical protein|nr:hypothetical protein [Treponema sp.]
MIVLDTNSFSSVFDSDCSDNCEFRFVLQWVLNQNHACFVFGGSKYKSEIKKIIKYLKLISELQKAGKFVEINCEMIDDYAKELKGICTDKVFNDEHLVSILNISGCKLLCTKDIEAMPYIKRKDFYFDQKIPRIYSGARNRDLLNVNYIVELKNKC